MVSELTKILLTSALTIIGGVVIYVCWSNHHPLFIDPYHEYRKIVGEIANALVYHTKVYMSGLSNEESSDEASTILRQKASLLLIRAHAIPCYRQFAQLNLVPSWDAIMKASAALIGLSNNVRGRNLDHNDRRVEEIIKALELPPIR